MKYLLKQYIRIHDWVHPRVISRLGCATYNGLHPKEEFGFRYKFFRDSVCKDDSVIDIACGTGTILANISDKIGCGLGIDSSDSQIAYAKKYNNMRNLHFHKQDIFKFSYAGYRYNVAILSHILEHIDGASDFLRMLDVDKLLICVPSKEGWYSRMKWHLGLDVRTDAGHYREYTIDMLKYHVEEAGYEVYYIGFNENGNIICRAFNNEKRQSCANPAPC